MRPVRAVIVAMLALGLLACGSGTIVAGDVRALVGPMPVVLLSTSWCGYCRKAHADFTAWGVEFREFDVETSDIGRRAYARIGIRGVPILLIGDKQIAGYSASRVRGLLAEAGALPSPAPLSFRSVSP